MNPISAVVITKNEAKRIRQVIENLNFAAEVIVVDNLSSDQTVQIATRSGARVVSQAGEDFSALRNRGLKETQNDWVLFVDADETVDVDLKNEIIQVVNDPQTVKKGFLIRRHNIFLGREMRHGVLGQDYVLRLAQKEAGSWKRAVHEFWQIRGEVGKLHHSLRHQLATDLTAFLAKTVGYARLHAGENTLEGKKPSFGKVVFYPWMKFVYAYFLKGGWRDGLHGLVYALIMSFHSFLAWGDAWAAQRKSVSVKA